MVTAPEAVGLAAASGSGSGAAASPDSSRGYATVASTTSHSTAIPSDPYAPSLSHLNGSELPHGYERVASSSYATFSRPIEQSPNDDRSYRLVRLDNGLECLLVSDPKTDKCAAGISVRVGHLSDPENAQGMAHFCEHLLFMGTEKYPSENDYNEYLSRNNGQSNAYTAMDETVYFFDVHPPALEGALDRFAQFFIAPLFTDGCTEREILAVDSENKKNLQSDMWRLFQLEKSTSSREHHYWRFGTGNKATLWDAPKAEGRNVRSELIDWYGRHYSANVMKLVVVGKEPLDALADLVTDKFAAVKNRNLAPPVFSGSPFTEAELSRHIYAQAVKNVRSLEVTFPLADQGPLFATKPGNFITHYLGHEGEGSILSYLKKLGWAEALGAGAGQGATGFDFFKISVSLTAAGLANHKKVAQIVFAYIEMLRATPPQEWAFKEQAMLNEISFRFVEKRKPTDYVTQLCTQMQKPYPREWLLSAPWLLKDWNPDLVREQLAGLTARNCRITVVSQEPVDGLEFDKKEQWYGTRYRVEPFTKEILQVPAAEELGADLFLPQPNSFIPSNLDILGDKQSSKEPAKRPDCVYQSPTARIWHKLDDRWWVPRAAVSFYIKNPIIDTSARNAVHTRLYVDLVMDAMAEYSYDADLAGLSYKLDAQADGIIMIIDGYNDKLAVLAKVVLEKMATLEIDPQRFEMFKDAQKRQHSNFDLAAPSQLAAYYTSYLMQHKVNTPKEKLAVLDEITPESLKAFIPKLLEKVHIEGLVHGNMLKDDAIKIANLAETTFKSAPLSAAERVSPLSLIIPDSSNLILRLPVPNAENVNSAIEYFCLTGNDADPAVRTKSMLFIQLINEPCFDTLRTKEQLGYLVHSTGRSSIGMTGFRISIQSERDAAYLESRVDAFLDSFEGTLQGMSDEQFDKERASLVNRLREEPKNLVLETMSYWGHIHAGYYDFERRAADADRIAALTKDEIVSFFKEKISPKSTERAKLSVHMHSQHVSPATVELATQSLKDAGVDLEAAPLADTKALLASSPTPTFSQLQAAVKAELERARAGNDTQAVEEIAQKITDSHYPPSLGEGKRIFEDGKEIRKLLSVGPAAQPVAEYKDTLNAKL